MCLPNVTEHIEAGLRRRDFLRYAGSAAAAGLFGSGEALAAPHFHDPDLDLEFAARMEGSAIAFTLTLHNPHREEIGHIEVQKRVYVAPNHGLMPVIT